MEHNLGDLKTLNDSVYHQSRYYKSDLKDKLTILCRGCKNIINVTDNIKLVESTKYSTIWILECPNCGLNKKLVLLDKN